MKNRFQYIFAQDQDYFNKICNGKIKFLNERWNACGYLYNKDDAKIIHYTIFKPWQINKMKNDKYFWDIAKNTEFYDYIKELKEESKKYLIPKGEESLKEFIRIAHHEAD